MFIGIWYLLAISKRDWSISGRRVNYTSWIYIGWYRGESTTQNAPHSLLLCGTRNRMECAGFQWGSHQRTYGHRDILSHQTNDMLGALVLPLPPSHSVLSIGFFCLFVQIAKSPYHTYALATSTVESWRKIEWLSNVCLSTHSKTYVLLTSPLKIDPLFCISLRASLKSLLIDFQKTPQPF